MAIVRRSSSERNLNVKIQVTTLHSELVTRAVRWLTSTCGCSVVLSEISAFTPTGEIPDAVGWRSNYSVLVECKASRGDFLADRFKPLRSEPVLGMGTLQKIVAPKGNVWTFGENLNFMLNRNERSEIALLVSAMRRKQQSNP